MINPLKYFRNRKVGLALGSGGSKGMAHIAVIEYVQSMGIPIDMVAGSSIGAVIGSIYAAGVMTKFKEDMLKKNQRDFYSMIDPAFPRSGLVNGKGIMNFLARYIPRDTNIEDLPIPLGIVATDYNNGKSVVFRSGNLLEAVRASMSIPGVFVPVRYRSTFLLDGGVASPLPVNVVKNMGAGPTIAVNLHPQLIKTKKLSTRLRDSIDRGGDLVDSRDIVIKEPLKTAGSDLERQAPWLKSIDKWIKPGNNRNSEVKMPTIFETIFQAVDIMSFVNTGLLLKYYRPSVLIEPDLMDVETLDFSDVPRLLTEGYRACSRSRNALIRRVKLWV